MKTKKLNQIKLNKALAIYDIGFAIYESWFAGGDFAGGLRALVAGESGVAAIALPPHSKFAFGWREGQYDSVTIGNSPSRI